MLQSEVVKRARASEAGVWLLSNFTDGHNTHTHSSVLCFSFILFKKKIFSHFLSAFFALLHYYHSVPHQSHSPTLVLLKQARFCERGHLLTCGGRFKLFRFPLRGRECMWNRSFLCHRASAKQRRFPLGWNWCCLFALRNAQCGHVKGFCSLKSLDLILHWVVQRYPSQKKKKQMSGGLRTIILCLGFSKWPSVVPKGINV